MPEAPNDVVRAHGNVRGTQSFVHVMASIFKRPGLVGLEIGWRWIAALPITIMCLGAALGSLGMDIHLGSPSSSPASTAFRAEEFKTWWELLLHGGFIVGFQSAGALRFFALAVVWAAVCGFMRSVILRRLDPQLSTNLRATVPLAVMRVVFFLLFVAVWIWMLFALWFRMVLQPEPAYVGAFAIFTVFTLLLFMLWSVVSWIFPLATTLAMSRQLALGQGLRAAWGSRQLRSKLIEINLVMGIVKVALLVLAMVFSACPLPFSNVETQVFLNWWWFGCFLFWVIASDYFHVVRAAAVLRLTQAFGEA